MPRATRNARKRKPRSPAAKRPVNARVRRYRDKMRALGFKPVTIWLPDTSRPGFAEEVRRQCLLLQNDPQEARILAEIEALTDFDDWK